MKINTERLIKAYKEGQSMNSIANAFGTYPTTVKRILEKHGVELRHDTRKEGELYVKDGEKLIEWAKAQGRLVTKAELANILGKKRLSPSYFIKYPELGQYVKTYEQKELQDYNQKLYNWLKENNITYKPNDRAKLGVSVDVLLLEEYEGLALQILEKPRCVSKKKHNDCMEEKYTRAKAKDIHIVFLTKEHFENLDYLKIILNDFKKIKEK
ncbi:MAG: hypothetical protein K2P14_03670 [Anaeroplasmataceae bacterium]|nr:hypothetical protein [Anaeroplasmataceae bacterium]